MISIVPVQLGLLDPLYKLFGWLLSGLYGWIGNYGLVVIIFTIVIRALLIPLGLRSQKSMLRQQLLLPDVNEIKRRYPKDPQRQQELTQELYKRHGISMMGGCLPSLIPLLIIWPLLYIFRAPLRWVGQVSVSNLRKIADLLVANDGLSEAVSKQVAVMDIPVIQGLRQSGSTLATSVQNGWIELDQIVNTDFLGIDLTRTPSWRPSDWFGADAHIWLPLLILVLITIGTYFIQTSIMRKSTPRPAMTKEEKAREAKNPAKRGQTPDNQMAGMGKGMRIVMPLIMLYTMFTFPAAMCLYWLVQNLMFILQSQLGYMFYVKPLRLAYEAEVAQYDRRTDGDRDETAGEKKEPFFKRLFSGRGDKNKIE